MEILERLARSADKVQMLIDHFEIREVIESYVHACDRADVDAVIDVYAEESWDDHGHMKARGHDYARTVTDALLTKWDSCNHLLGQSRIKVSGDTAGAETLFYATQTRHEDGVEMLDQQLGRYIDRLERIDGRWSFIHRRCIQEWMSSRPLGGSIVDIADYLRGQRSESDLSYEVLGLGKGCSRITR